MTRKGDARRAALKSVPTSAPGRVLWPNIGAEEGDAARFVDQPAVAATRGLWRALFDPPAPFAVLDEAQGLVPWLVDEGAHVEATRLGLPLFGPGADVVARVHDKAFALGVARDAGLEPATIAPHLRVFDRAENTDDAGFARTVRDLCSTWPAGLAQGGFTLKPRFGTSGRGRVGGAVAPFPFERVRSAATRLAARGGTILEPWLPRETDLSVVAWISPPSAVGSAPPTTLLAVFEQLVHASGLWLGHRGEIDRRGRIYSGTPWDDEMREAAAAATDAARAAGHAGPCGLDGFTFEDRTPDDPAARRVRLRPLVEINARFTLGHVCAGWLRRTHAAVVEVFALSPGRRVAFLFALAPPAQAPDWEAALNASGAIRFDLLADAPGPTPLETNARGPLLLFHDDATGLEPLARRLTAGAPTRRER